MAGGPKPVTAASRIRNSGPSSAPRAPRRDSLRPGMTPLVEISNGGRAGSVTYREGQRSISLDWEFALSPALAVISGPSSKDWERACPWGAGRQEQIFEHVASEVVRQKAAGCRY